MFSDKVTMKKVLPSPPLGGTEVFDAVDDADDTLDDDGDDDIDDDEVSLTNDLLYSYLELVLHLLTICFVSICVENLWNFPYIVCSPTNITKVLTVKVL